MYPILQIANTVTDQTVTGPTTISPWGLTCAGGWTMIVLLLLSLVTIYVLVTRYIELHKVSRPDGSLIICVKNYLQMGRKDSTIVLCKEENIPRTHMIEKGLERLGQPASEVLSVIENVGSYEVGHLERRLSLLATIIAGASMIGFLGTVTSIVQAFFDLANAPGDIDVSLLLSGIYQALVTTVGGLIVDIVALFLYNYLVGQVSRVVNRLGANILDFMDVVNKL